GGRPQCRNGTAEQDNSNVAAHEALIGSFESRVKLEQHAGGVRDQLLGRFSERRGQFGFLICRELTDKSRFIDRCNRAARDGQGYVIPLDDADLTTLVEARKRGSEAD